MFGYVGMLNGQISSSLFTIFPLVFLSFSVLIGPINHIKHLVSKERLPFSFAYLSSLGLTLYFALGVCSPCSPTLLLLLADVCGYFLLAAFIYWFALMCYRTGSPSFRS